MFQPVKTVVIKNFNIEELCGIVEKVSVNHNDATEISIKTSDQLTAYFAAGSCLTVQAIIKMAESTELHKDQFIVRLKELIKDQ